MSGAGRTVLACAVAGAVGLGVGFLVGRAPWREPAVASPAEAPEPSGAGVADLAREIVVLQRELADETARRERLELRLAGDAPDADASDASDADAREDADEAGADGTGAGEGESGSGPDEPPWVDRDKLARGGFAPSEIEVIEAFLESLQLERLYLRDRAAREGWENEPRFRRSMRALDLRAARMREEYGEDAYDWILYASGRPNRVVVRSVMADSQAEAVGLQEGDVFLSYDGERIFGLPALRSATTRGALGETADVEVLRDGRRVRVFPEHGPLGVALRLESREPDRPAY